MSRPTIATATTADFDRYAQRSFERDLDAHLAEYDAAEDDPTDDEDQP